MQEDGKAKLTRYGIEVRGLNGWQQAVPKAYKNRETAEKNLIKIARNYPLWDFRVILFKLGDLRRKPLKRRKLKERIKATKKPIRAKVQRRKPRRE